MAVLAQGARLWVPDEEEVWQKATVISTAGGVVEIKWEKDETTHTLPDTYYLRNEEQMTREGIKSLDDLTQLTHLHEAALLHSLHERFEDDAIYTFTGPILIAVNPFKRIPGLYDEKTLKHFIDEGWKQTVTVTKKPHVFSTAVDAYRGLCTDQVNQTILISGESGAGKTESTKFVMKLLALAGSQDWQRRSPVENQVLQSNPLLEAFGNAKTLRNDNSSRFGKFIEMQFRLENDRHVGGTVGRLAGARIQTYLLETVRVCRQLQQERNYHAFYQLAAMVKHHNNQAHSVNITKDKARSYGIDLEQDIVYDLSDFNDLYDFRYLNSSGCTTLMGVDDVEEFERTALAMDTVGVSVEEQQLIWQLVGCVLEIGGLYFGVPAANSEASEIPSHVQSLLRQVSALLQVSPERLEAALCSRTIIVQRERYKKPLTVEQAEDTRDALARALYGTMFLRIVYQTNQSIGYQDDVKLFAGVLDIFGFECFEVNSFEQLCINFTNERLQQFFNTFIFKFEEVLYREEGIHWDPLDFPDNQDCVDLMSANRTGIFAMLDEECLVPKGSDQGFCGKLKQAHKGHRRFGIIKTKADWFTVGHFAGPVSYCARGFLDKNRDQLSLDVQEVIKSAGNKFVANLFNEFLDRGGSGDKKKKQHITVSLEFRTQLSSLMNTVQATSPHFIRCVKPNPRNRPNEFHRKSVAEQLRYAGVLQAVQVSRAGFPVRDKHKSFFLEYRTLLPRANRLEIEKQEDARTKVQQMMEVLEQVYKIPVPKHGRASSWAVGASLVFLKHEAYQILSTRRYELRQAKAIQLQAYWKMFVERRAFLLQRAAAVRIQCAVRQWRARRQLRILRENRAQIIIAAHWKRYVARKQYLQTCAGIILIQSCWRMHVAKQLYMELRRQRAAIRIQAAYRMHKIRVWYLKYTRAVVLAQLRWRQIRAKRMLRKLKLEARNTANLVAQKDELANRLKEVQLAMQRLKVETQEEIYNLKEQLAVKTQELEVETERSLHLKTALEKAESALSIASTAAPDAGLRQELEAERSKRLELEVRLAEEASLVRELESMIPASTTEGTAASPTQSPVSQEEAPLTATTPVIAHKESLPHSGVGDASPVQGTESASTAAARVDNTPPSAIDSESPGIVQHIYDVHHPETDVAVRTELQRLEQHVAYEAQKAQKIQEMLELRELELAEYKRRAHEADQLLQSVLPCDQGEYVNQVIGFLKPSSDLKEDHVLKGDVLLVGDLGDIANKLLTPLEYAMQMDNLNLKRLEELKLAAKTPASEKDVIFQKREFDLQILGKLSLIRLTVAQWSELQAAEHANKTRLARHFRYVVLCSSDLDDLESLIENPLWSAVHSDCRRVVVGLTNQELGAEERCKVATALQSRDLGFLTVTDLQKVLPEWARLIHIKREELNRDMTNLMEISMKSAPLSRNKSTTSPMSKSQAASIVNQLIGSGVASFFGAGKRTVGRGRSTRLPPPPVSELLLPSLNGDQKLLAESRDREKALKHGEVLRWYSIGMLNKTAVTCLKFGNLDSTKDFYLLAVATKAGTITTYKIRRTSEEKARAAQETGTQPPTPAAAAASDTRRKSSGASSNEQDMDPGWDAAPEEPVETWRQFEGHSKAVTSIFFNQSGTLLVSTSIDNSVRFWDLRHGYLSKIFSDSVPVLIAAFFPADPRWFITSNSRQVVRVVDSEAGHVVQRMKVDSEIRALCFDACGLNLIAGTKDGALEVYEIGPQNKLQFTSKMQLGGANHAPVTCVRFCPGQPPFVVVNSCDNTITIANCNYSLSTVALTTIVVKQRLKIPHTCVPLMSCLLRRDEYIWLVSGSEDHKVKVHAQPTSRETDFQLITELKGHETTVLATDINDAGTILASADVSGCVHLWRHVSYKQL